ncbi:MBL fold hydrolase [Halorientalis sp. IM1011]|uniref:MBL fold metallo-hydrolase n=1 Tax=Halorientalis sp. IM1011 TaxID=1932360 RepID=UPI00097CC68F|nr:MBL fold metallo-hydrolase [Halorientalis sp. IM1011]AQL43507.1 MBL fold hydrolase [Halorientalis sp. IM1011]
MVTELGDDVWWYDLLGVNAYLVDDGTVTLVDAGNPWDGRNLVLGVDEAGYSLQDVDRVLLTHYDFDHVGGLGRLQGLDATVYVGAADEPFLTGKERPPLSKHKGALQNALGPFLKSPALTVETVADGDEIGSFTAYHTPGHTPGHVAYVSEALDAAFLGDLVRESGGKLRPSPWLMSYDTDAVEESIRDLAERAPEFSIAAMGHGTPFEERGREALDDLVDSI